MKKNDPYTRMQRQQLSTLRITIPLLGVIAILEALNPRNDLVMRVLFLVPFAIVLIVGIYAIFRNRASLTRLEQRRERALQGDSSLLAREQPLPDPQILPLPTTIKLDQSRRAVVFLSLGIALVFFILFAGGTLVALSQSPHRPDNHAVLLLVVIILGGVVIALLAALFTIFLMRRQLTSTIVVDERGISSTYQGITSTINWSDVRLFAVLTPDKPSVMRYYELSNEQTAVCWANMPARTLFRQKKNIMYPEYQQKVQALLSLIAARTGLPLYDLS